MTKGCASQSLKMEREGNLLKFTGPMLCGKHGQRDHWRLVDLSTMEIRGIYADSTKCRWLD